jgi:hypothetical protein
MTNYPIKSLDNKFTYGIGINDNNKSDPKIIIQLSDLDEQKQIRVSMNREEFYQFTDKLKEYYLHYF